MTTRSDERDLNFFNLLNIVLDSRWLIAGIAAAVSIIAIIYATISTPIYQANTLIQVENSENNSTNAMGEMAALLNVQSPASAEIEILRSRLVVGQAADALQLYIQASPQYLPIVGTWLAKHSNSLSTPRLGGYVTGKEKITLSKLEVPKALEGKELTIVWHDGIYDLLSPDGDALSKGAIGELVKFNFEGQSGELLVTSIQANPGAKFKLTRFSRLDTINLLQAQLNITEKGKPSGMIAATLEGPNPERTASILNAIGSAYVRQNIERKAAEAEKTLSFLDNFLPELRAQMRQSEEQYTRFRDQHGTFNLGAEGEMSLQASSDLQKQLLDLQQKKRELTPRFQSSHPAIKTLDTQIEAIKNEMARIERNVKKMPDLEQQLLSLMRNVQVDSEMYVNLLNSAQQLRLVKEGKVGNVRVVDPAAVPERPIKPNRLLVVCFGILLGLVIGIFVAILRSMLRPGIQEPAEIESSLGLHVYSVVPHSSKQEKLRDMLIRGEKADYVLATNSPNEPAIESLRSLRTALQFATLSSSNNIILISGPTPGIGKSFTSVNFSAVLGSTNKRVLLIDGDLRKGHLHQYFGQIRGYGLSELITNQKSIDEVLKKKVSGQVDFLSTGTLPPNPSELLLSENLREILKELSSRYDIVVLDTAPILPVSDATILMRHVGTIFMVARAQTTTLGELEESKKRVMQVGAAVNGIIFNDLVASPHRYGSKYSAYQYSNYEYNSTS